MKSKRIQQIQLVPNRRSGVAMIMAILLLLISTSICFSMVRTTSLRQSRFENRQWKLQANLLADSALERAAQQLRTQPDSFEEVWEVTSNNESGEARMSAQPANSNQYEVTVVATYPSGVPQRAQTTVRAMVDVSDLSGKESTE